MCTSAQARRYKTKQRSHKVVQLGLTLPLGNASQRGIASFDAEIKPFGTRASPASRMPPLFGELVSLTVR